MRQRRCAREGIDSSFQRSAATRRGSRIQPNGGRDQLQPSIFGHAAFRGALPALLKNGTRSNADSADVRGMVSMPYESVALRWPRRLPPRPSVQSASIRVLFFFSTLLDRSGGALPSGWLERPTDGCSGAAFRPAPLTPKLIQRPSRNAFTTEPTESTEED